MDRIEKLLRTLPAKERAAMQLLMEQLKLDSSSVPGIKALSGMRGWFRVRMGQYRILLYKDPETKRVDIRRVTRRNEKTYKNLW